MAVDKPWTFPWPKNHIHFKVDVESVDVDGYKASRLLLKARDLEIGGAINRIWSVVNDSKQSFRVRLLYQPNVKTWFYVFPKSADMPVKNSAEFLKYAQKIQQKAEKNEVTPITFKTNQDGELIIRPDISIGKRSVFYNPGAELTEEMLQFRPKLFGRNYFQLFYTIERDENELGGTVIFVDLGKWTFCAQMEVTANRFPTIERSLSEFLSGLYLETGDTEMPDLNNTEADKEAT